MPRSGLDLSPYEIIKHKRDGGRLDDATLRRVVDAYVAGQLPDYQMSALLMAIWFRGLDDEELTSLTWALVASGDTIDLSAIPGTTVDKHSTGGVGDKTTLILAPLVASCGVPVAKMSGRGLGHTGGTVDKLESIPGFRTELEPDAFIEQVKRIGVAVVGQSGELAPGDKKLYALRDVTATVDSLPLIAASIMSKKIAAGSGAIQLDVKTGSGAFMKSLDDAIALAQQMCRIGEAAGRPTRALVTDMDCPLGHGIGNALEVAEAIRCLRGEGPADLEAVSLALAAGMLELAGHGDYEACHAEANAALHEGRGLRTLAQLIQAQGGDAAVVEDTGRLPQAARQRELLSPADGWIAHMDAEGIGLAAVHLRAGRRALDDVIDPAAGLHLLRRTGEAVRAGEPLAILYGADDALIEEASEIYLRAIAIDEQPSTRAPLIQARVSADAVERYT